jgi:hypothetical protein
MAKLQNELSWSVSREQLFRDCRRAYYYQYYGSWGGWEGDASHRTRTLYILKNIKSLAMWAGTIVHETVAEALNRFARSGTRITAGELQRRARIKLRNGWVEAVNREWERNPKKTNLFELYYGNGKTLPREKTERVKERVYGALEAFADSDILARILATPYLNWQPVDTLDSFQLDGLKVWCAIDFAYVDPAGAMRIIDWKTGGEKPEALRLQLGCYALYACEKWHANPETVRLHGVFLGEGARVSDYAADPAMLVETKDRILSSAAQMREPLRDAAANLAAEEDFPGCGDARICRWCNYRGVCPEAVG